MNIVEVIERQLEAYNSHELDRFLAEYSEDIRAFRPPALEPSIVGKAAFGEFYATQRFNRPGLHADVLNRMVLGSFVIDHERISGIQDQPFEVAIVYHVVDGLIQCTWAFAAR